MLIIGFWNVGKNKNSEAHIIDLMEKLEGGSSGANTQVLFCIAERGDITEKSLEAEINSRGLINWQIILSNVGKFILLSNLELGTISPLSEREAGWPISLVRSELMNFYIWFVHLGSPYGHFHSNTLVNDEAEMLARACQELEESTAITDSVVIGDFNMDPYSEAMIAPKKINAVMCRNLAVRAPYRELGKRGFVFRKYPVFYNPMWNILGDQTNTNQPGSFYNSSDNTDSAIWHAIDQVLLRPTLVQYLEDGSPKILTHTGKNNLLKESGIINKTISDHLPIMVSLNV